ncbi:putative hydroxypyruvate isomerase [Anthonomus grandis grandis]|uniref:putative hydroxypyruvate isomerase n=1 Tax=Anthonomus grandis grandis TaxID=2921223 RepID=UPI0021658FFD|nr:putative hydroxypyruvate isomerase [Anthonomus grandis grandis]
MYLRNILLSLLSVSSYSIPGSTLLTKKMPKFCANLSFLFKEKPFLERYALAKRAGFSVVESGFPYGFSKEEVVQAQKSAGVEQVLVNILTGDVTKGELGFAAVPGKEKEFQETFNTTIDYAKALGAKKIHIMSGRVEGPCSEANDAAYINNLKYAAKILEKENIIGLIEPINKYSVPNYYMNSYEKAINVIKTINSPFIKLQLDIFHLQLIKGQITHTAREVKPYVGHVQIAQAPHRHEPDVPGEINYEYVFDVIRDEVGYSDYIGLEYTPKGDTEEGLKWVKNMGLVL